jgi:hypothetical protein
MKEESRERSKAANTGRRGASRKNNKNERGERKNSREAGKGKGERKRSTERRMNPPLCPK